MNRIKPVAAILLFVCYGASPLVLAGTMTIECAPPRGQRVQYGTDGTRDKPTWFEDGYTGVRPVFIFNDANPNELLFLWGDTRLLGVPLEQLPATKASVARVLSVNDQVLSAIMVGPLYVETYVFFFFNDSKTVFGTFGSHRPFADGAKADMLSSLCQVAFGE